MRAALLALVALSSAAHADERDDAKREFAAGQAADKLKDYRAGIEHYLRAFELSPHPFALFNIAADYEQLGDLRQAVHFYEKYISATEDDKDRNRVQKLLADLKARPAQLTVHSQPEGAQVFVDNRPVGQTPYAASTRGGRHLITVELDGQKLQKEISIDYGEPVDETFRMAGPTGASGAIQVSGAPFGAEVTIDNVPVGNMPVRAPEPPGEHVVRVQREGFTPFETTAVVQPGSVTDVRAVLPRASDVLPTNKLLVYYMVGATAGADVRGDGAIGALELGMHALRYDVLSAIGRTTGTSGGTSVDLVFRYYFTDSRLAPFIGGGYSYVQGGGGYEIVGGLRWDITRAERFGLSLLAYYSLRTVSSQDSSSTSDQPTVFMPVAASLELEWR